MALQARVRNINIYTDSQLVAMQMEGSYEIREQSLIAYLKKVKELMAKFAKWQLQQILRKENAQANALSKFGAAMRGINNGQISLVVKE